jgi:hypothetical protein
LGNVNESSIYLEILTIHRTLLWTKNPIVRNNFLIHSPSFQNRLVLRTCNFGIAIFFPTRKFVTKIVSSDADYPPEHKKKMDTSIPKIEMKNKITTVY